MRIISGHGVLRARNKREECKAVFGNNLYCPGNLGTESEGNPTRFFGTSGILSAVHLTNFESTHVTFPKGRCISLGLDRRKDDLVTYAS